MNSAFKRVYTTFLVCSLSLVSSTVIGMEVAKSSSHQFLLGNESDVNREINGIPLIFYAVCEGDIERVKQYIEKKSDLTVKAFIGAERGKVKEVKPYEYARFIQRKEIAQLLRQEHNN